jgi:hypothetical protein
VTPDPQLPGIFHTLEARSGYSSGAMFPPTTPVGAEATREWAQGWRERSSILQEVGSIRLAALAGRGA